MFQFDGIWWLLLSLGPLFLLQRTLHKEFQGLLLNLTRRMDVSIIVFSILFLPGVFLHELSHFLTAKLLRVKTGKLSLIPQYQESGRLRLGYIETEKVDFFRDALIGLAPLVIGIVVTGFIVKDRLGLITSWQILREFDLVLLIDSLREVVNQPNFWVWFYLSVVVSSTMMPSPADRKAWIPLLLFLISMVLIGVILGFGPILADSILYPINNTTKSMALVFGLSGVMHTVIILPVMLANRLLIKLTRVKKSPI